VISHAPLSLENRLRDNIHSMERRYSHSAPPCAIRPLISALLPEEAPPFTACAFSRAYPSENWFGITVILHECGSTSISARVSDCGGTRSAGLGSKKRRTSSPARITRITVPTCRNSVERSAGLMSGSALSSFEVRQDEGAYHLVTLWRATREERTLYEEHS
jgi:hypothetical protein